MKGQEDTSTNTSSTPAFAAILRQHASRRQVVWGGLVAAGMTLIDGAGLVRVRRRAEASTPLFGFQSIPASQADTVVVPPGSMAQVLFAWGDPVSDGPVFKPDTSNTADEQALQDGMHHDALHFFPLPMGSENATRGLLVINYEYPDDGLLHVGGMEPWTAGKVAKSQAAHGVSIIEVAFEGNAWKVVRPSPHARRITGRTPMRFSGPAAGHALLQTAADPTGTAVLGTLNNCAHGVTPWGTYLTCEENFNGYFVNALGDIEGVPDATQKLSLLKSQNRYGITKTGFGYRWHEHEARFDAARHPHEPHRFGWVVEIYPFDPQRQPIKHTALGRCKHEGAWVTVAPDNRVVVYMGDDERNEYIYKFVSEGVYVLGDRAANLRLLERGTLYAAKFSADGTGEWLALVQGQHGLDAAAGFPTQAEVVIQARAAADVAGATKMDRPEWMAVHPTTKEVYCTLTNNTTRGTDKGPAVDAANPRANNVYGHILRWLEQGGDACATRFAWDVFVLCGDPAMADTAKQVTIQGDIFGSPDGLWFDARGVLWIQTDISASVMNRHYRK